MIISPEIIVTPDYPRVMLREAEEKVDLDTELPRILQTQGWEVGTPFYLQFISHDRSRLLSMALYVVTERIESLQTSEANPQQPVTRAVSTRRWAKIADLYREKAAPEAQNGLEVRWNPGKQAHEVLDAEGKVQAAFTKEDGGKEAAEAYASGQRQNPGAEEAA